MNLPERIVHAAETAIEGAARDVYPSPLGDRVDGFTGDLARTAGAAVVDVLAEELKGQVCCGPAPEPQCLKCGQLRAEVAHLRMLAQDVLAVTALKAV